MNRLISIIFLSLSVLAAAVLAGCAEKPPSVNESIEFSATLMSDYGDSSAEYRLDLSRDKARVEMVSPGIGTTIIRKDAGVVWTLMTDKKLFLELQIRPENKNPLVFKPDKFLYYEKLGEETVDGRTVIKERVVIQNEGDVSKEFYRWFDPVLGWPVMAEATDGKWKLRLTDIKPGPQDPFLFELPADYMMIAARKRAVPGGGPH